jgi:hypothetical protein
MFPPAAASYQVIPDVDDKAELAFNVWIGLNSHWVILPLLAGALGAPVMVKVTAVLVKLEQVPFEVSPYKVLVAAIVLTKVGGLTMFPPLFASYQTIVDPGGTVAVAVKVCCEPVSHTVTSTGAVGAAGVIG